MHYTDCENYAHFFKNIFILWLLSVEQEMRLIDQSAIQELKRWKITITLHMMAFSVEIDLLVAAAELKEKKHLLPLNFGSYITPRNKNWPIIEQTDYIVHWSEG